MLCGPKTCPSDQFFCNSPEKTHHIWSTNVSGARAKIGGEICETNLNECIKLKEPEEGYTCEPNFPSRKRKSEVQKGNWQNSLNFIHDLPNVKTVEI